MIKKLIKFGLDRFANLLSKLPSGRIAQLIGRVVLLLNQKTTSRFTLAVRPKNAADVAVNPLFRLDWSSVGVIVQGPYIAAGDMTLETIRLYKKIFPKASLILSTWENSVPKEHIPELRSICELLFAIEPKTSGSHNFNKQKATTLPGILRAQELGVAFALKTRTDQRIYNQNALTFCELLIKQFPVVGEKSAGRIVELGIACCKFRPWSLCDMFQFAHITDLRDMWDVADDPRNRSVEEYSEVRHRVIDIVNEDVAEIRLHRAYARKRGYADDANYESYYKFIRDQLIIVDKESVDIIWDKYLALENAWAGGPYYGSHNLLSRLTYADWLILVSGHSPDYAKFQEYLFEFES